MSELKEEIEWRPVHGWASYEISRNGDVRRMGTNRLMAHRINQLGYVQVALSQLPEKSASRRVHRLLVEAYIRPLQSGEQVNHINGIKTDNSLGNLEICSPQQNMTHASQKGLLPTGSRHWTKTKPERISVGSKAASAKLSEEDARRIIDMMPPSASQHRRKGSEPDADEYWAADCMSVWLAYAAEHNSGIQRPSIFACWLPRLRRRIWHERRDQIISAVGSRL